MGLNKKKSFPHKLQNQSTNVSNPYPVLFTHITHKLFHSWQYFMSVKYECGMLDSRLYGNEKSTGRRPLFVSLYSPLMSSALPESARFRVPAPHRFPSPPGYGHRNA